MQSTFFTTFQSRLLTKNPAKCIYSPQAPPADLTAHTALGIHPDGRLYDWITNGFPDSVMPAFDDQMTKEERWHLVNYIRTLVQA